MPLLVKLNLISSERINVFAMGGKAAHGFFLKMIQDYDANAAEELHRPRPIKPFTLSVSSRLERQGQTVSIPEHELFQIRITVIDTHIENAVFQAVLNAISREDAMNFAGIPVNVASISDRTPVLERVTHESILRQTVPEKTIALNFRSPTAFRRIQDQYLFPDPDSVFSSILSRWNAFSPCPLSHDIMNFFPRIRIARYQLQTRMLSFKGFRQLGFCGTVLYNLDKLTVDERFPVALLSNFAYLSGVGAKTTMGMGICRRESV